MADFEQTYLEYRQMIHAFLLRLCGNAHLAEELTQETFYQAFKHWSSFRGQSSVSTWLCTIAKRQLYNAVRRKELLPIDEAVYHTGNHGCLASAPADGFDFFNFICINQQIIGTFEQFITEVILQPVCKYRHITAVYKFNQLLNMMFFQELTLINENAVDVLLFIFPHI